jgi:magnesium transporter
VSRRRALTRFGTGPIKEIDPSHIDAHIKRAGTVLWLDIEDPEDADVQLLREEFEFHELALEDVARRGQRPKIDAYDDYYFFVLYAAYCTPQGELTTQEIHCFWGLNFVVTLHDGPVHEVSFAMGRWVSDDRPLGNTPRREPFWERARRALRRQRPHAENVAFQVYLLLDAVVDGYFPVIDVLADCIEEIEDRAMAADQTLVPDVLALRRQLVEARRVLGPTRDVLNELMRAHVPVFPRSLDPYLTDVYDHIIRAMENLDLQRDLLVSAMESYLSVTSNRLNQTMRTLTSVTIGLMVPTLVAGIYGMNYPLHPLQENEWGFWFAIGLMALTGVGSLVVFRVLRWL